MSTFAGCLCKTWMWFSCVCWGEGRRGEGGCLIPDTQRCTVSEQEVASGLSCILWLHRPEEQTGLDKNKQPAVHVLMEMLFPVFTLCQRLCLSRLFVCLHLDSNAADQIVCWLVGESTWWWRTHCLPLRDRLSVRWNVSDPDLVPVNHLWPPTAVWTVCPGYVVLKRQRKCESRVFVTSGPHWNIKSFSTRNIFTDQTLLIEQRCPANESPNLDKVPEMAPFFSTLPCQVKVKGCSDVVDLKFFSAPLQPSAVHSRTSLSPLQHETNQRASNFIVQWYL